MQTDPHPTVAERPLSLQEAAQYYGVSITSIHNWIARGELKTFKRGRRRYVPLDALVPKDSA
jgi:excisionase family DNA binding protein